MSDIRYRAIMLSAVLAAMLGGLSCWGKPRVREFYLIEYLPQPVREAGSRRPYPVRLQLETFRVLRVYNRQQILFRYSPNRMQYYTYKTWAVRPEDMITDMVEKHLLTSDLFIELHREFLDARPDYRLEGVVEALEKYDAEDIWFAHLAMTFRLIREEDRREIWHYTFDERKNVHNPEMVYTVRAMSDILEAHMGRIVEELDRLFLNIAPGAEEAGRDSSAVLPMPLEVEPPSSPEPTEAYEFIPGRRPLPALEDTAIVRPQAGP